MIRFLIIFFTYSCILQAATTITLVTDQHSMKSAQLVKEEFLKTPPFSLIPDLEIKIIRIDPKQVTCKSFEAKYDQNDLKQMDEFLKSVGQILPQKCREQYSKGFTIERLEICNNDELLKIAADKNVEHLIFIKDNEKYGGSGGEIPVINSGSPASMAIHEFLHKFGIADEYAYGECEAPYYCYKSAPNVAIFNDSPPYSSDAEARKKHASQIPWFGSIKPATLITTGTNLGTPTPKVVGLFKAVTCEKAMPSIKSWKPGSEETIMEILETNYIPVTYWPTILTGLGVDEPRANQIIFKAGNFGGPAPVKKKNDSAVK